MLMQLINVTKQECKQNHNTVKSVYYTIVFLVEFLDYFNRSRRLVYVKEGKVKRFKMFHLQAIAHTNKFSFSL